MAIHFRADNPATWKFLAALGFSAERIISEKGITDAELRAHGVNPHAVKALADPSEAAITEKTSGDYYLGADHADRGFAVVQTMGGPTAFRERTAPSQCLAEPHLLRFTFSKQVLDEPQPFPNHGFGNIGAYALQSPCHYDPALRPVEHGVLFPAAELPAPLRKSAAPAVLSVQHRYVDGTWANGATAVMISSRGYLLTNRHVVGAQSHDNEERCTGKIEITSEQMPSNLFVVTPEGKRVLLSEKHVVRRFPGYDLALLHVPALAGRAFVRVGSEKMPSGTPHYILGYAANVYAIADKQREGAESTATEARSDACHQAAGDDDEKDMACDLAREETSDFEAPNLANLGTLFWSTGEFLPLPNAPELCAGDAQYHSNALLRPGMSGGAVFAMEQGRVVLVGIANQIYAPPTPRGEDLQINSSLGVSVTPFAEYLQRTSR